MITCLEKVVRAALTGSATFTLSLGTLVTTASESLADDDLINLKWSFHSLYGQFSGTDGYPLNNGAIDPQSPSFGGNLTNHTLPLCLSPTISPLMLHCRV
jgi:hypothetical protein